MIAVDSRSAIAYLANAAGPDIERIDQAISEETLRLPPAVLSELLSSPKRNPRLLPFVDELPLLPLSDDYWRRVGDSRALLRSKGLKAQLADALVAQCCIDLDIPLITRDADFRHFAQWCGLRLAV